MSVHLARIAGETLAAVGDRIRKLCPIAGPTATDRECRVRRELVDQTLEALGTVAGPRLWHSAQLDDGHVVGIWATSVEEAEIDSPCGGRATATGSSLTPTAVRATSTSPAASGAAVTPIGGFP